MLYLVLFSSLAVGFYTTTTLSVQVVANDRRTNLALLAAESGMDFIRFQLADITIPHGTTEAQLFSLIYSSLQTKLNDTGNLASIALSNDVISIPANNAYIYTDSGSRFQVTLENLGQKVRVKVIGRHDSNVAVRAIQLDYGLAENASQIFDYGVASRGKITTGGHAKIRGATDPKKGSILSTCMTDPTPVSISGDEVSGDISISNPAGLIYVKPSSSIAGSNNPHDYASHLHKGVAEPEFPAIDTDAFTAYATNTYTGGNTLTNVRIPANTNPKFTGGVTIKGVLYIEAPNKVEFGGNANIQGVIVVQNNPSGTLASNIIDFQGTVSATGVQTLPESYGDLRKLTGSFLLAPNFKVSFGGDFGTVNGSIIAGQVSMTGNAGGTIMGSVINLNDVPMTASGSSEIIIASTGTNDYPAGVFFSSHYAPLPDTYAEVQP
jgi:hypothetical protein